MPTRHKSSLEFQNHYLEKIIRPSRKQVSNKTVRLNISPGLYSQISVEFQNIYLEKNVVIAFFCDLFYQSPGLLIVTKFQELKISAMSAKIFV